MLTKFDEQAQKVIVIAESLAFDMGHNNVGSEHLLLSILKMTDSKLKKLLNKNGIDEKVIYEDIKRLFGTSDNQPFYMEYSEKVKDILEKSIEITKEHNKSKVTLNILSIALLLVKESVAVELLNKYDVDKDELVFVLNENNQLETKLDQEQALVNLNKKVKKDHYKIIGRDKEVDKLCSILSKKEKNNALIIGEAGVGKSALVEKLAMMINNKQVPKILSDKIIYELSLSSIVAGTKYRGEFEEKLRKIIDKARENHNIILFIDEIHNIIGAGGAEGAIDASNILKPYLARKDITIIGATTTNEYYSHFEKDQAMNRRFSLIMLDENTKDETYNILKNIKSYYEKYHNIKIDNTSLLYLVDKVDEYIKSRTFPDKAIDILDLACVKCKFNNVDKISKDIIKEVIEEYTSIEIDQSNNYGDIENKLNSIIIGQNKAISKIIKELSNKDKMNILMLIGSSGVGKSETAKQLAKLLNRNLIKLDMASFNDGSSISKLIGSPPGYIGYDKPSLLLPKLQLHPRSIILLDDIDKSSKDVLNIFSQIFDDGYLEDNQKRKVYFNNTIIIMTSSIQLKKGLIGFKREELNNNINSYFSDDFINRIDKVIRFKMLDKDDLAQIIKIHDHHLGDDNIQDILANYNNSNGARGIIKRIKEYQVN